MLRRSFIQSSALSLGYLVLGYSLAEQKAVAAQTGFANAWIRVGSDNSVTMVTPRAEVGQDIYTTLPLIMAEELDFPVTKITVEQATADAAHYGNPHPIMGGNQVTGGSTSVRGHWDQMRTIGASARFMFIQAAAKKWGVSPTECSTADGFVLCGAKRASYGELTELAALETPPEKPALKDPKDFKYIGQRINRLDTPIKVNGGEVYGMDHHEPGMLVASVARCPVMGGKLISFDDQSAKAIKGVLGVYKIGEALAVVADDFYLANKARGLLKIKWDFGDTATRKDTATIMARLHEAAKKPGVVVAKSGNFENPVAGAAQSIHAVYEQPLLAHASLEPENCCAMIKDGECHVWGPFQLPGFAKSSGAAASGLPPEKVIVHSMFIGGSFGRKMGFDYAFEAVAIAKASGRPIKLIWTREDDIQNDFYRPPTVHQLSGAVDAKGKLSGLMVKLVSPSPSIKAVPPWVQNGVDLFMIEGLNNLTYEIPNHRAETLIQDVDVRVGYWRSVSNATNAFAVESFIDELATLGQRDPLEFRLEMLGKQPRAQAVLKLAAEKAGWGKPLPAGQFHGIAHQECYQSYLAVVAEVSVKDGVPTVHRLTAAVDVGIAIRPNQVETQVEGGLLMGYWTAMVNQITLKDGQVEQDNFDTYKMLRFDSTPLVDVHLIVTNNRPSGIGEAGVPLAAPAIGNAIAKATGVRPRKLPFVDA